MIHPYSYNFEMQEDAWTSGEQLNDSQVPSQSNQMFKNGSELSVSNMMEPLAANQLELNSSCGRQQQEFYRQHSTISEPIEGEANDFNNNQQTNQVDRRQNLNNSTLSNQQAQDAYNDQLFSSNNTFYSHNANLTPAAYNQDSDRQYNLGAYNDDSVHHLAMLGDLTEIEHGQSKSAGCYAQEASTSVHLQQYYDQQDSHSTLDNQLYQQPVQLDTPVQVVFKQNDLGAAQQQSQQHHQTPAYSQQTIGADQYQAPRTTYSSLQQLTMNCENYANQVPAVAADASPADVPDHCTVNRARLLKNRRGRPRKKGLRSKSKYLQVVSPENSLKLWQSYSQAYIRANSLAQTR